MKKCVGTTRTTYLIGNRAYKFPRVTRWNKLLKGLLNNLSENFRWKYELTERRHLLCPVIFCSWGGWFIIMPRTEEFPEVEYDRNKMYSEFHTITHDLKRANFGKLHDRTVLHDYADDHYNCSDCVIAFKRQKDK
jgi:hypothetical protein